LGITGITDVMIALGETVTSGGKQKPWHILRGELLGAIRSIPRAMHASLDIAWKGLGSDDTILGDLSERRLTNTSNVPLKALGWTLETFWGRFSGMIDIFYATLRAGMLAGKYAGQQAQIDQQRGALGTQSITDRVDHYIDNPTPEMIQKIAKQRRKVVFQGEMGNVGNLLATARSIPGIGRALFPVLKVTYHAATSSLDMMGIGMIGAFLDAAQDPDYAKGTSERKGARDFNERIARGILGMSTMYGFYLMAQAGALILTGPEPEDKDERRLWRDNGYIPHGVGVKSPFGGRAIMMSAANFGSLAFPLLAMGTRLNREQRGEDYDKDRNVYLAMALDMAEGMLDAAPLSGIKRLVEQWKQAHNPAVDDPYQEWGERIGQNLIQMHIPLGATTEFIGRAQGDNILRIPTTDEDWPTNAQRAVQARMPDLRNTPLEGLSRTNVPPLIGPWGEPLQQFRSGKAAFVPFAFREMKDDPINKELLSLEPQARKILGTERGKETNILPDFPPAQYNWAGTQEQPAYKFTKEEKPRWQELVGRRTYEQLQTLFESESYKALPVASTDKNEVTKHTEIGKAYSLAKRQAWEEMGIQPEVQPQNRPFKYAGIEQRASREGVDPWRLELEIDEANDVVAAWNRDRTKPANKRTAPTPTQRQRQLAGIPTDARYTQWTKKRQSSVAPFNAMGIA
jgi:hypothetical protein